MTIIIIIILVVLFAYSDACDLKSGFRFTNHTPRFVLRFATTLFVSNSIIDFIASGFLFYALFDYILNIFRNKPILYIGKVSFIDRLWGDNKYMQLTFKIILLTISIILWTL